MSYIKLKLAAVFMIALFFLIWGPALFNFFGLMYILGLFFPVALFFKPSKWTWFSCVLILLLHAVFLSIGLVDSLIHDIGSCPSCHNWNWTDIVRAIAVPIICIIAIVLLFMDGKRLFQPASLLESVSSSKPAKGLKYWQVLLILFLAVAFISAPICLMAFGGSYSQKGYYSYEQEIQDAVTAYRQNNSDTLPVISGTSVSINGSDYAIVDLCELFIIPNRPAWQNYLPYGIYAAPGPNNDNCDGSGCCGCCATSHYIWAVDNNGSVLSTCVNTDGNGGGCANTSQDGFQNVWP